MIGQATAAGQRAPRRWLQRVWGLPYIHARQDWSAVWPSIAGLPSTGVRLLDAGCGGGHWSLEIAARRPGWTVVGLDRDASRLRDADERRRLLGLSNLTFVLSDFAEFGRDAAFDVVLSVCSAHYLAESGAEDQVFDFLASALAPGGRLLLYGPRAAAEVPWIAGLPRPEWHPVFTAAQLERLCAAHDLEIDGLQGHLGRAGTMVKQVDLLAAGRWRRFAMAAGLYGVEYALSAIDRRVGVRPGTPTLMWLLSARRRT